MDSRIDMYMPVYEKIEKEIIELSSSIFFVDELAKVYSLNIANLIIRCAIEIESLIKDIYRKEKGCDPKSPGDCLTWMDSEWNLSKKTVSIISPYFHFESLKKFAPFDYKNNSEDDYYSIYNAIKHDRVKNIKKATGQKIIIENQLEQSNHDHLGKVITYASGLDAKVIVWIVKDAREEHRSAVEWLNNNTNKEINFFLIEIHAYKIGDSLYAPKFEIVEKPNDFIKTGKIQASSGEMNKSQSERLAFWTRFNEVIIERGRPFNVRKASTDHWYDVAIGTSAAHLGITLVNKENCIGIELYISDDKSIFDRLYAEKDVIEKELGLTLDWQRLDGKKASRIVYRIPGLDFDDHSNYDTLMNEAIDKIVAFSKVFKKYMK